MTARSVHTDGEHVCSSQPAVGALRRGVARIPRRVLLRRLALAGVAAATVTFAFVDARAAFGAARLLEHVRPAWLALAVVAETVSLLSFGRLRRVLLWAAQVVPRRDAIVAVTLAGTALARVLPGGAASAGVWAYRQLRRRGTERSTAIWVLLVAGALSSLALFVVIVAGVELGGGRGPSASLRWAAAGLASVPFAAGAAGVVLCRCPASMMRARHLVRRIEGGSRAGRRCGLLARGLWSKLRLARLSPARWLATWLWGLGNWVFDAALLVICMVALGGTVPWRGVVFAYGLAQVASVISFTPGGVGLVEASLAGLLVAEGVPGARALAVVVLYRGVSLLVVGALGAGAGLRLRSFDREVAPGHRTAAPLRILACTADRSSPYGHDTSRSIGRQNQLMGFPPIKRRCIVSTRYVTNVLFMLLGGFVVVASRSFRPSVVGWIAFAFGIAVVLTAALSQLDRARGLVQRAMDAALVVLGGLAMAFGVGTSGSAQRWTIFAVALGWVAFSVAGLTIREIANWRSQRGLGQLHFLPAAEYPVSAQRSEKAPSLERSQVA